MCQEQSLVNQTEMLLVFMDGQNPSCYNLVVVLKLEYFKSFVSERKCGESPTNPSIPLFLPALIAQALIVMKLAK